MKYLGIKISFLLTLFFVVLKLLGYTTMSWWVVLLFVWLPPLLIAGGAFLLWIGFYSRNGE